MPTSMTSLARVVALAAMLCGAAASAQGGSADAGPDSQGESVNPHSVENKNRTPPGASTPEERRSLEKGEADVPASVLNKEAPPPGRPSQGQINRAEADNPNSVLARKELSPRELIDVLHVSNLDEIAAGKLAQEKGGPRVADYGRMLVTDHQAADDQLNTVASQLGMKPADQPKSRKARSEMSDAKKMQDKLSQLSGPAFDGAFVRRMAQDHRKEIEMVQVARATCKEAALCTLLDQTLPTLRAHEQAARALERPTAQGRRVP
jgi:putative membrane protein